MHNLPCRLSLLVRRSIVSIDNRSCRSKIYRVDRKSIVSIEDLDGQILTNRLKHLCFVRASGPSVGLFRYGVKAHGAGVKMRDAGVKMCGAGVKVLDAGVKVLRRCVERKNAARRHSWISSAIGFSTPGAHRRLFRRKRPLRRPAHRRLLQ